MVLVGFETLVVLICLFSLAFWIYYDNKSLKENANDIYDALEHMDRSLSVVAVVLEKLPEMVPQFQINESPLTKLLEFFQTMNKQDGSLTEPTLRDNNGRYSDGETKEQEKP